MRETSESFERERLNAESAIQVDTRGPSIVRRIGVAFGIGLAGTLDEIMFHQLLQWHNFYVHTTEYWRIVSDGLLHLFSSLLLSLAAMMLWVNRRRIAHVTGARNLLAGTLAGAGGFNLYDGIINHKILQLHPVREGVQNILPYDIAWNGTALAILAVGVWLWRR
jgi:uncharacterized membrane protein